MNMTAFTADQTRHHPPVPPDHEVIIVGAGISGIGAAIQLKADGVNDILILERDNDVGGTWRDNRYPGIAWTSPPVTYSFSFEQNANWSRVFAPGNELYQYTRRVSSKYGIYRHIRFGVEVERAQFDTENNLWVVSLASGETLRGRHLISACGGLIHPSCLTSKVLTPSREKLSTCPRR